MIREKPILFAECDSFDEVVKLFDEVHAVLRTHREKIESLEARVKKAEASVNQPPPKTENESKTKGAKK